MAKIKRSGLVDEACSAIKEMLMNGDIRPGDPILEVSMSNKLQMSRTPVREALFRLEMEGFVKNIDGRIRTVVEVSPQDLREIYEIREFMEGMAARLLAPHIRKNQLDYLMKLAQQLDNSGDISDEEEGKFHEYLITECGNKRLSQFASLAHDLWVWISLGDGAHMQELTDNRKHIKISHVSIVQALADHDPDRAEALTRAHLVEAKEQLNNFRFPARRFNRAGDVGKEVVAKKM